MKNNREIMEILEAYDLTGSYRAAAGLTGVDHHTVARYVKMRAAGPHPDQRRHRARAIDDWALTPDLGHSRWWILRI